MRRCTGCDGAAHQFEHSTAAKGQHMCILQHCKMQKHCKTSVCMPYEGCVCHVGLLCMLPSDGVLLLWKLHAGISRGAAFAHSDTSGSSKAAPMMHHANQLPTASFDMRKPQQTANTTARHLHSELPSKPADTVRTSQCCKGLLRSQPEAPGHLCQYRPCLRPLLCCGGRSADQHAAFLGCCCHCDMHAGWGCELEAAGRCMTQKMTHAAGPLSARHATLLLGHKVLQL
jgi:hypothetical protein